MSEELKQQKVIVVDGIIAAGKTTLIYDLALELNRQGLFAVIIPEPEPEWTRCGILQKFYEDKSRWGYHFQTKVFTDRIKTIREYSARYGKTADVFILERSPISDMIFMESLYQSGTVTKMEWEHYLDWCSEWIKLLDLKFTHSIFLTIDIDIAMKRIKQRNRPGEEKITLEYQEDLKNLHEKFFEDDKFKTPDGSTIETLRVNSDEKTLKTLLDFIGN